MCIKGLIYLQSWSYIWGNNLKKVGAKRGPNPILQLNLKMEMSGILGHISLDLNRIVTQFWPRIFACRATILSPTIQNAGDNLKCTIRSLRSLHSFFLRAGGPRGF